MTDSAKNGGDQTKFETRYQSRVDDIAGKYQDPLVRETFLQIVDYGKNIAKDAAQYRHKKEGDELLKALEHDIDYGLQLTHAVDLAEKICDAGDAAHAESGRQKTALELTIKELEGQILHHQGIGKKLEADYQTRTLQLKRDEYDIEGKSALLTTMRGALEEERNQVYCAKSDFYELAMQAMTLINGYAARSAVPLDDKCKELLSKMTLAVEQLQLTGEEKQSLKRYHETKRRLAEGNKP